MLLFLVLLPTALIAQKKIAAKAIDKSKAISLSHVFKNYSLFSIDASEIASYARSKAQGKIDVELHLPSISNLNMELDATDILNPDYKLIIAGPQGKTVLGKPANMTYSGKLPGDDSSSIYLTITDQNIFGFIRGKGKEYFIEPLKYFSKNVQPNQFVVYESKDIVPHPGLTCGAAELKQRKQQITNSTELKATGTCRMVEVAIASDNSMVARYGTAAEVQERNIGIMNMMVGIYHNAQIGTQYLEFTITGQYIATSSENDPLLPAYNGSDGPTLLQNFSNWGEAGGFGFRYDVGQFWTATDFSFGMVGLAWIGGLCTSNRYELLEDFSASTLAKADVAAHETGHILNAQHDAPGAPYVMAPSISDPPYTSFSSTSLTAMSDYLNSGSGSCLSACNQSKFVAQFSASADAICLSNTITFTDNSVGGALDRNWDFGSTANPTTSTSETQTVSFSTPGVKTVQLTSYGFAGGGTLLKNYYVFSPVKPACRTKPTAAYEDVALSSFSLAKISHRVDPVYIGSAPDQNFTCSDITALLPGTTYTANANLGWAGLGISSKIQVLIDYNNDGDFLDENESVHFSEECQQGNYYFTITTPETVPVINTLLRMRVIAIPCSMGATDGCAVPSNCQLFDFGVYFLECASPITYYRDADGDGYGSSQSAILSCQIQEGYVTNNTDCDDQNALKNPATKWIRDADGDGFYPGNPIVQCPSPGSNYIILTNQQPGDCNDADAVINPATVWYKDADNDGYSDGTTATQCVRPSGYKLESELTATSGDCNDTNSEIHPGKPIFTCPSAREVNLVSNCQFIVPDLTTGLSSTNNCSNTVFTQNPVAGALVSGTNNGTYGVTVTATDDNGYTSSCNVSLKAKDMEKPEITCPLVQVLCYNTNGSYTIPSLIATDNCSINSIGYVITGATSRSGNGTDASGIFNPGISTIEWTVTDANNNTSTCSTTVKIDKVDATIPDVFATGITSSIGSPNTIYLGYGGSSVTLAADATSNLSPNNYTYKWTTDSPAGSGFADTQSIIVTPSSTTTYFVSIKDVNNCAQTVQVSMQINVVDIRCGKNKINVCQLKNGSYSTSCVSSSPKTVTSLPEGSHLGTCVQPMTRTTRVPEESLAMNMEIRAMPNPTHTSFQIVINSSNGSDPVQLLVTDILGRAVETRTTHIGQMITIGDKYKNGIYFIEFTQNKERKVIKLIKL